MNGGASAVDALSLLGLVVGLGFAAGAALLWLQQSLRHPGVCLCGLFPLPGWADEGESVSIAWAGVLHTAGGCWERLGSDDVTVGRGGVLGDGSGVVVPAGPQGAGAVAAEVGPVGEGGGGVRVVSGGGGVPGEGVDVAVVGSGGRDLGWVPDVDGPVAAGGAGVVGPGAGVLLIHRDVLVRAGAWRWLEVVGRWESSGRVWWHEGLEFWVCPVSLPLLVREEMVAGGWPGDAVEVGGR